MSEETVGDTVAVGRCPVARLDIDAAEHARSWRQSFADMRSQCPRAWVENHGGFWVATRYDDVVNIAQNADLFTSGKSVDPDTGAVRGGLSIPPSSVPALIPDETDNPEWKGYRKFLNPRFSPKAAEEYREFAESAARMLMDEVIEAGRFDIVEDMTNPLPAMVTMKLFGFDMQDWRSFAEPVHQYVYTSRLDPGFGKVLAGVEDIRRRIVEGIADRKANPGREDLLSYLVNGEMDGRQMTDHEVTQTALNIIFGGVDTTTALTSNVLLYLGRNPDQRQRLIDEPGLLPYAREEFLRYFSPVHGLARHVSADTELDGWRFGKGERVFLSYASANQDEAVFENPDQLVLDRFPNRHIGFGAGMHRCLGSFFARLMFESMVTEVLKRIPDYRIVEAEAVPYPSVAKINGWMTIPATFTPGTRLNDGLKV